MRRVDEPANLAEAVSAAAREAKAAFGDGRVYLERDLPALARRAREKVRKTVEEVAREIGLSPQAVAEAERFVGAEQFEAQKRIVQQYTPYCITTEKRFRLQRKKPC